MTVAAALLSLMASAGGPVAPSLPQVIPDLIRDP